MVFKVGFTARTLRHRTPVLKSPENENGWQWIAASRSNFQLWKLLKLPVSAAVGSPTTVETTRTAVETAAAVEP